MSDQAKLPSQEETPPQEGSGRMFCSVCGSDNISVDMVESTSFISYSYLCNNCGNTWRVKIMK